MGEMQKKLHRRGGKALPTHQHYLEDAFYRNKWLSPSVQYKEWYPCELSFSAALVNVSPRGNHLPGRNTMARRGHLPSRTSNTVMDSYTLCGGLVLGSDNIWVMGVKTTKMGGRALGSSSGRFLALPEEEFKSKPFRRRAKDLSSTEVRKVYQVYFTDEVAASPPREGRGTPFASNQRLCTF